MIRAFRSHSRTVVPPWWAFTLVIVIFGLFSIPWLVFGQQAARPDNPPSRKFLVFCSILFGAYRVIAFHPYYRPDYLRWLKSTPWTVGKPLPLGPVELIPVDGFAIGLLILLSTTLPQPPRSIELVISFLLAHMAAVLVTFWRTGASGFGYAAVLLLGFVPLLWARPWLNLLLLVGIYLFVHEGLWHALKRFPWETEGLFVDLRMMQRTEKNPKCGWFFDRFHRDISSTKAISPIDALLGCMLGSWWLFVISAIFPTPIDRFIFLNLFLCLAMIGAPLGRLAIYGQGCRWPINLRGRVGTFRWIIPGYDQVLVGPICAFFVGRSVPIVMRNSGIPPEICLSAGAGLTLLVALMCPPKLRHWRLTGQHRLGPTFQESQEAIAHKMGQP